MDKRTGIDRTDDAATTRDRAGMDATTGDPRAVNEGALVNDTAPDREGVVYESTHTTVATYDADRDTDAEYETRSRSGGKRTPEDIERDIERTRAEMSETIDEIEGRLTPQYFKEQVKESIHETIDSVQERLHPSNLKHAGKRAGKNMFEAIKENPLPAILTGIGLAWWMKTASEQGGNDFRTAYANRYPRSSRRMRPGYMEEDVYYSGGEPMYYEEEFYAEEPSAYRSGYEYYEPASGSRSMAEKARGKASQLKHQASDTAHEVADRAGEMAHKMGDRASELAHEVRYRADSPIEAIKENPLPALLIGAGIAWWMKSSSEQSRGQFRTGYYPRDYGYYDEGMYYGGTESEESSRSIADRASELKHEAGDKARELSHRAEDMAHQAQRQMRRTGRQVQYRARRATNWLDDMMHENPIGAGALALGAGALVGLALPSTRREDELMGSTRDYFMDEARDVAGDYAERAQHVAERATQEIRQSVKEVAQDVAEAAKDEAKKQGLTGSGSGSSESTSGMSGSSSMPSGSSSTASGSTSGTSGYTGTKSGTTGASTGQIGGSTTEGSTSGIGSQSDRNKSGSNR